MIDPELEITVTQIKGHLTIIIRGARQPDIRIGPVKDKTARAGKGNPGGAFNGKRKGPAPHGYDGIMGRARLNYLRELGLPAAVRCLGKPQIGVRG